MMGWKKVLLVVVTWMLALGDDSCTETVCEVDYVYTSGRVVVVADVHGDKQQFLKALRKAAVIGDHGEEWTGGNAVLVQTGDIVDRGPDSLDLLLMLKDLKSQAAAAGGCVVQLLGNHEVMNMAGDFRYAEPEETANFGGLTARRNAFGPYSPVGSYLRTLPLTAKVVQHTEDGSNFTTVFAHAGVNPSIAQTYNLKELNALVRSLFDGASEREIRHLQNTNKILLAQGPIWTRTFANPDETLVCPFLDKSLEALGSHRMIIGHTVQANGKPNVRCNGKLVMADAGMSRFYGGGLSIVQLDPAPGSPILLFE